MKTKEQIDEGIIRLKKNKGLCPEFNHFNDNNYEALDVMIDVLREGHDEDWVYENYPEEDHEHTVEAALSIIDWMNNDSDIEDYLYPEPDGN